MEPFNREKHRIDSYNVNIIDYVKKYALFFRLNLEITKISYS